LEGGRQLFTIVSRIQPWEAYDSEITVYRIPQDQDSRAKDVLQPAKADRGHAVMWIGGQSRLGRFIPKSILSATDLGTDRVTQDERRGERIIDTDRG